MGDVLGWAVEDDIELLAFLEYCRKRDGSGNLFKQSVKAHFGTLQKTVTLEQADSRIQYLWEETGIEESAVWYSHDRIYGHGINCLGYIANDRDLRKRVSRRLEGLHNGRTPCPPPDLEKRQLNDSTAHGRRSAFSSGSSKRRQSGDEAARARKVRNRPRGSRRTKNSPDANASLAIVQDPEDETQSSKKQRASRMSDHSERNDHLNKGTIIINVPPLISESGSCSQEPIYDERAKSAETCERAPWSLPPKKTNEHFDKVQDFPDTTVTSNKDLTWYQRELAEKEQEIRRSGEELSATQSAAAEVGKQLMDCKKEIKLLQMERKHDNEFYRFTRGNYKQSTASDFAQLKQTMITMQRQIDMIMLEPETQKPRRIADMTGYPELDVLCNRACGGFNNVPDHLPFQCLLRSLVSAAICEWVFESNFEPACMASTPLMDIMLKNIRTQDGEDVVRNIHFAAHHTLVQRKYFYGKVVPKSAQALAERLIEVMTPIFTAHVLDPPWKFDAVKCWKKQGLALKRIFVTALEIKVQTMLSGDIFEVDFPSPGTAFCNKTMAKEEVSQCSDDALHVLNPCVSMSLAPGLRWFEYDRKLVDHNSFRKPGEAGNELFDLVAPSLVMVK